MVGNNPGSGFDVTARTATRAMEDAKIARNVEVFNLAGASGTVALQRLVNEKGNGDLMMMMESVEAAEVVGVAGVEGGVVGRGRGGDE